MLESVLENQRKFLEDHDIKIQELENVINNIVADKEDKDKHSDTGKARNINLLCLAPLGSAFDAISFVFLSN